MDDAELDDLMARTAEPLTARTRAATVELAERSRLQLVEPQPRGFRSLRRRSPGRRPARWLTIAAAVLGGAVVLTAGTSLAAYQLSIPPFQDIPDGIQRLTNPVPVDFDRVDGVHLHCLVFLEFRHLSTQDYQRMDSFIATSDWSLFGQRLDSHGPAAQARTPAAESDALFDSIDRVLYHQASRVISGLVLRHDVPGHPTYAGYGASCRQVGK